MRCKSVVACMRSVLASAIRLEVAVEEDASDERGEVGFILLGVVVVAAFSSFAQSCLWQVLRKMRRMFGVLRLARGRHCVAWVIVAWSGKSWSRQLRTMSCVKRVPDVWRASMGISA